MKTRTSRHYVDICGYFHGHFYKTVSVRPQNRIRVKGHFTCIRGVFWNAQKGMWKMILSCDSFCHFFQNAQLSYHIRFALFSKCPIFPISELDRKNGAFRKKSTWSILKQKKNRKWNSSIFGHFEKNGKSYHMTKSSFTCLFGHFKIHPVYMLKHMFLMRTRGTSSK